MANEVINPNTVAGVYGAIMVLLVIAVTVVDLKVALG